MNVCVHLLPALVADEALLGRTVVVIDLLRATTTMLHALAAGAVAVHPVTEVALALRKREELVAAGERVLLGGERHGVRIDGFDLDNSPSRYVPETVAGRHIVFTTTNGTRALRHAHRAERVLIAALANVQVLAQFLAESLASPSPTGAVPDASRELHILCAGTDDAVTAEDVLTAGHLLLALRPLVDRLHLDDGAMLAESLAMQVGRAPHSVEACLSLSRGGRNLLELGYDADIRAAARLDTIPLVAEYRATTGRLTAVSQSITVQA